MIHTAFSSRGGVGNERQTNPSAEEEREEKSQLR